MRRFILLMAVWLAACSSQPAVQEPIRELTRRPTLTISTETPTRVPTKTNTPTPIYTPTSVPTPLGQTNNWRLVFADEFEGRVLDSTKWTTCWSYGCGTTEPNVWYTATKVIIGNGIVRLRADNRSQLQDGRVYSSTSGMLSTGAGPDDSLPRFTFQYGYFEARVKVPAGAGLWPAFWLLTPTQRPPEIDIMEVLSRRPSRVELHYHYTDSAGVVQDYGASWDDGDFSAGWHTFGLEWRPDAIVWYVDGVQRSIYRGNYVAAEPLYLILNLQVGNSNSWSGAPDATTVFPAYYDIDYVRVWQPATPYPTLRPTLTPSPR